RAATALCGWDYDESRRSLTFGSTLATVAGGRVYTRDALPRSCPSTAWAAWRTGAGVGAHGYCARSGGRRRAHRSRLDACLYLHRLALAPCRPAGCCDVLGPGPSTALDGLRLPTIAVAFSDQPAVSPRRGVTKTSVASGASPVSV